MPGAELNKLFADIATHLANTRNPYSTTSHPDQCTPGDEAEVFLRGYGSHAPTSGHTSLYNPGIVGVMETNEVADSQLPLSDTGWYAGYANFGAKVTHFRKVVWENETVEFRRFIEHPDASIRGRVEVIAYPKNPRQEQGYVVLDERVEVSTNSSLMYQRIKLPNGRFLRAEVIYNSAGEITRQDNFPDPIAAQQAIDRGKVLFRRYQQLPPNAILR